MWFISVGRGTVTGILLPRPRQNWRTFANRFKKLSVKECMMESCNEVLTFGYVDEILWCEN